MPPETVVKSLSSSSGDSLVYSHQLREASSPVPLGTSKSFAPSDFDPAKGTYKAAPSEKNRARSAAMLPFDSLLTPRLAISGAGSMRA